MGLSNRGKPGPHLGKKFSKETCRRISDGKKGHKMSSETRAKMSAQRQGPNHGRWKGGIVARGNGYLAQYCPNHPHSYKNKVYIHRLVMEKHIGRYLLPEEDVHHINGIKTDNRIENLMLFKNRSEHRKYELSH